MLVEVPGNNSWKLPWMRYCVEQVCFGKCFEDRGIRDEGNSKLQGLGIRIRVPLTFVEKMIFLSSSVRSNFSLAGG